jgi:hypothetical protein
MKLMSWLRHGSEISILFINSVALLNYFLDHDIVELRQRHADE